MNQYMVYGFDSISIAQVPAMISLVSAEGSLNRVAHSILMFFLLTLSKSFLFILCAFDDCLPTQFSLVILGQISAACSES